MTPQEFQFASREFHSLLKDPSNISSAATFEAELQRIPPDPAPLINVPSGVYLCGCPWVGQKSTFICPIHPGCVPIMALVASYK